MKGQISTNVPTRQHNVIAHRGYAPSRKYQRFQPVDADEYKLAQSEVLHEDRNDLQPVAQSQRYEIPSVNDDCEAYDEADLVDRRTEGVHRDENVADPMEGPGPVGDPHELKVQDDAD